MSYFSSEDVKKHNQKNSLWIVHGGKVYDVTEFAERHPGGRDYLLENADGYDVSNLMQKTKPHRHSKAAYLILKKYFIGNLVDPSAKSNGHVHQNGKSVDDLINMQGYREDEIVDWSKPMLCQVGNLGALYSEWVHSPVDRHIRLFHSDFCERFSKTPWYHIPIVWIPVLLFMLFLSYQNLLRDDTRWIKTYSSEGFLISSLHIPFIFVSGIILWTFFEYVLHRWLFHVTPPNDSKFLITLHFLLHGQHHKAPFDNKRLVFPIAPATVLGMMIFVLYICLFPLAIAQCLMSGTLAGYVAYDLTHYYTHHGSPTKKNFISAYFQRMKNYHVRHHFENQMKGFGISSKFWDYPFNSLLPEQQEME